MKYTRPEAEIMELEMVDVIQTSTTGGATPGVNGTPIDQLTFDDDKNVPTI